MKPVYSISILDYTIDGKSEYKKVGHEVDTSISKHFAGKHVALRYLSMQDHEGMLIDDLIASIDETGTDKYDPDRKMSVAHDFYAEKGVELFAVPATAAPDLNVTAESLHDFYEGALVDRGYSLKIDLVVVYDLNQLESVPIQYDDGIGSDGFKFRYPDRKPDAVLGFVKILER